MSCWAITVVSQAITGTKSFYETTVSDATDFSSAGTEVTLTCAWYAGFNKLWSISYETDASNHQVTGARFLPNLVNNVSPTGDFRFAPATSENPDQASDSSVWVYGGTGASQITKNTVAFTGATSLLGAASVAIALLMAF